MTSLPVFFTAMFLLNVTPGPDLLYVPVRATCGFFRDFAVAFFFLVFLPQFIDLHGHQ